MEPKMNADGRVGDFVVLRNGIVMTVDCLIGNGWIRARDKWGNTTPIRPENWQPLPNPQTIEQAYFLDFS